MTSQTILTFTAEQKRPTHLRGIPCQHTIARDFPTLADAESYARRILGQRPGVPVEIRRTKRGPKGHPYSKGCVERVAIVSRDALDRTWTDIMTAEAL